MRNLRAELQQLDDNIPVEWNPAEGGILVGTVSEIGAESLVVEDERTGAPVVVSLAAAHLAALWELQNPRVGDRIGAKYLGPDAEGQRRYVLVVDRDECDAANVREPSPLGVLADDCAGATQEERDFLESMVIPEVSPEGSDVPNGPLAGLISRGEQELASEPKTLERLEVIIGRPSPPEEKLVQAAPAPSLSKPRHAALKKFLATIAVVLSFALLMASVSFVPQSAWRELRRSAIRLSRHIGVKATHNAPPGNAKRI